MNRRDNYLSRIGKLLIGSMAVCVSLTACNNTASNEAAVQAEAEAEEAARQAMNSGAAESPSTDVIPTETSSNTTPEIADLIGTFGVVDRGAMREFIRISFESGSFIVSEKLPDGTWRQSSDPLIDVSRSQFETMVGQQYTGSFQGLANNGVAIFQVPTDFRAGNFTISSGYFVMAAFGPMELHKL
jgi:hypothetical protein